jgi:hypothetical protein
MMHKQVVHQRQQQLRASSSSSGSSGITHRRSATAASARAAPRRSLVAMAMATEQQQQQQQQQPSRRQLLAASLSAAAMLSSTAPAPSAAAGKLEGTQVGSYLPSAGIDDFVLFVPDGKKTPAIRAGTVSPDAPYRFALPPTWREAKVANIASGNYCQPRCAEPWTEVIFENEAEGRAAVIVAPLVRLTPRKGVAIEDVGDPAGLLTSLGPFITGTYLDEEDVVSAKAGKRDDGLVYYSYEINAPYGTVGPHTVSAATVKGDLALMIVVSGNEKQWARNEAALRKVAESFRA